MAGAAPESMPVEPLLPDAWVVRDARPDTRDVTTLVLEPGAQGRPFAYHPGQFNMLYAFGVGEVPISMSGDPADLGRLVHTIRDVGAVTRALCRAKPGDVVGVRGPFGSHWPIAEAEGLDVLIVAGGIGLAPLRPVIDHLRRHRARYGRVAVLCGARQPGDLLYPDDYDAWRGHGMAVDVTVDHASPSWTGQVGVVPTLIRHAPVDVTRATAFVCGPEVMMRFAAQALEEAGMAPGHIWISMERNMQCAVGFCGHCQLGPAFVCMDGPVFAWPTMARPMAIREL